MFHDCIETVFEMITMISCFKKENYDSTAEGQEKTKTSFLSFSIFIFEV